jgi:hypothetical protein
MKPAKCGQRIKMLSTSNDIKYMLALMQQAITLSHVVKQYKLYFVLPHPSAITA